MRWTQAKTHKLFSCGNNVPKLAIKQKKNEIKMNFSDWQTSNYLGMVQLTFFDSNILLWRRTNFKYGKRKSVFTMASKRMAVYIVPINASIAV